MKKKKIVITPLDQTMVDLIPTTPHKILGIWAADCAERVLPYFEKKYPKDNRPRKAIETLRKWIQTGVFNMSVIRKASLDSHAAARDVATDDVARSAARAAGQAVATAHVPTHSIGAARYAASAIRDATNSDEAVKKESEWQYNHLLKLRTITKYNNPKYMKIKLTELKQITNKAILTYGYTKEEAKAIKDILLYAQLRGNNQGIVKLIGDGISKRDTAKTPLIVKETPVSALYNGNDTHAMLVMNRVTDTAIEKAKKSGIGIVGNFNTAESTGALGYYVNKIAREGLIGIAYASSPFQTTAPYGSTEARFCTNPMAYGIPTETDPIILDMSTSAIAYYGLIEAKTANKKVSEGIGYDKDGNPTQNPAEIMSGAIKTFGGHKGSGLALIVQIFAGALVQADSFDDDSNNAGNLVIAIDPEILTTKQAFTKEVSSIVKRIKSARKAEGVVEISIPGEQSNSFNTEVLKSGEIEVENNLFT